MPEDKNFELKVSADTIVKWWNELDGARSTNKDTWQECAFYFYPPRANIMTKRTPGEKFAPELYDSSGIEASQIFAAGLMGHLTNPASRWFTLQPQDKAIFDNKDVKIWFKAVEEKIYDVLSSSNFYDQVHEHYIDLGVTGTPVLYEEEDPVDIVRFYSRPIEEVTIRENKSKRVDTVVRKFPLTVKQAWERWGDRAGEKVVEAYKKGKLDKTFDYIHAVFPRETRDVSKSDAVNMPFESRYVLVQGKKNVQEGGFFEFPFFVPRYGRLAGEAWAFSPAMIALADMKQLNRMEYTITRAGQKIVEPPLILPHDGYLLPFKTGPNAINYRLRGNSQDKVETLDTKANIPIGFEMAEAKRQKIKRQFFNDLFLLLADKKNMTATEVAERVAEKMLILGPVLGRLMSELLDPVIVRTFNILVRNGLVPEPPQVLQNQTYVIEYVSPLARAQRLQEVNSITNVLQIVRAIAETIPDVLDKIDSDSVVDEVVDVYGVSPEMLRSDDEVNAIREQRQQQIEFQQRLEALERGAGVAKTAGEAEKNFAQGGGSNGRLN